MGILGFSQQTSYVDFKIGKVHVTPNDQNKSITGTVIYDFEILENIDSIYIDAVKTKFYNVALNNEKVNFKNDEKKLWLIHSFKKGKTYSISFNYEAIPKRALYFVDKQIWTQGQGKYTSNWLPSFDDMNEKVEFDLTITFDKDYKVISNGKLITKVENDTTTSWHYDMQEAMSSYLVAFAIGKYDKKVEYSKAGIPLEMYYYPKDSLKIEPTYRYSKQIFDFLEKEIGISYPWQNYKQIPVKDFLYAGMENTSTTIFSDSFITDSIGFIDRNYVNVNAHELAHQWFGNLVTEVSGTHHWLQEGFATYYALLAEKNIFGDDYYYWRLYESAQQLHQQDIEKQGTSLLDPKSSSLTFYQKGAWVLHLLRDRVGDIAFKSGIKNYLQKHQFGNVETNDFISEIEIESEQDLSDFVSKWIINDAFPLEEAILKIKQKATFLSEYEMVDCEVWNSKCDRHLTYPISDKAKIKLISQRPDRITTNTFKNSIEVRQAIAAYMVKIPLKFKSNYETLLNDESYQTVESALFNLWNNFKEDQILYLNKTKEIQGFSDKNIRTLWLALAIITPNYEPKHKIDFMIELTNYTSPKYAFEIRQNAFRYLKLIRNCGFECVENLKEATTHHNWRFKKMATTLLEQING